MQPYCSKCNGETEFKKGISKKNDKPWEGWKCLRCGNMDFIKTETKKPYIPSQRQAGETKQPANVELELLKLAVQLTCSHVDETVAKEQRVLNYFKNLKLILTVPPPPLPAKEEDFEIPEEEF